MMSTDFTQFYCHIKEVKKGFVNIALLTYKNEGRIPNKPWTKPDQPNFEVKVLNHLLLF